MQIQYQMDADPTSKASRWTHSLRPRHPDGRIAYDQGIRWTDPLTKASDGCSPYDQGIQMDRPSDQGIRWMQSLRPRHQMDADPLTKATDGCSPYDQGIRWMQSLRPRHPDEQTLRPRQPTSAMSPSVGCYHPHSQIAIYYY